MEFLVPLKRLWSLLSRPKGPYRKNDWPSVVMLLRAPVQPSSDEVMAHAQLAWGAGAAVEMVAAPREGASHVLRSGPLFFAIHHMDKPYGSLERPSESILDQPWRFHAAWMAIDAHRLNCNDLAAARRLGDVYKILLAYVHLAWSENCLGLYFPAEGATIPNLGELDRSFDWARRNGLTINFTA